MALTNDDTVPTFEEVFVGSYSALVRSVSLVCGDADVAADCVADAFERAFVRWKRIGRYDDPAAWVRRVALNRARDHYRRQTRGRRAVERLWRWHDEADASQELDDVVQPAFEDTEVSRAIRALSPRQQQVALAFYVEHQPIATIAVGLGLSEGAVKYHLHEARQNLARLLGETREIDQ